MRENILPLKPEYVLSSKFSPRLHFVKSGKPPAGENTSPRLSYKIQRSFLTKKNIAGKGCFVPLHWRGLTAEALYNSALGGGHP